MERAPPFQRVFRMHEGCAADQLMKVGGVGDFAHG